MKEMLRIIGVLTIVCMVCAFVLALVSNLTQARIQENATKRIQEAITALSPSVETVTEIPGGELALYKLTDKDQTFIGYAFLAQGQGYQGKILMLATIDASLTNLGGIEIIDSVETPGLGAKIQDTFFRNQFSALLVTPKILCTKETVTEKNQIQAITGATISSRAVVTILNKRIEKIKSIVAKQKQER